MCVSMHLRAQRHTSAHVCTTLPDQEINMCAPGKWMFVIGLSMPRGLVLSDLRELHIILPSISVMGRGAAGGKHR